MKRLIVSEKRKYECSICGLSKWNDRPLRLVLDHIDGDNLNNCEENLRLVCPNCNSQTLTFCRGKRLANNGRLKWWESCSINNFTLVPFVKKSREIFPLKKRERNRTCSSCGSKITSSGKTGYCLSCARIFSRKVKRPSYEQLLSDLSKSNFLAVGRKYGVSDNAVRKWLKVYNKTS